MPSVKDTSILQSLAGKLLIAMPGLNESRFDQSVVFLCTHTKTEAMGLIVNKPMKEVSQHEIFQQLDISTSTSFPHDSVYNGGPVDSNQGFVLHTEDYYSDDNTLNVLEDFSITSSIDVLEKMAQGDGPMRSKLMLGYAGWGAGQLDFELRRNIWLLCDATPELVYETPETQIWEHALNSIGVSARSLSVTAGRA